MALSPAPISAVGSRQAGMAWDAVVIGAGHNGLVAAAYLARAGLSVLVLERRERVGGIADTVTVAPGARVPAVAHTIGQFKPSVVRDLGLRAHGLTFVAPDVRVFAPAPDGSAITLYDDVARTADGLRARSGHDAASYAGFDRLVRTLGKFLAELARPAPPDIKAPSLGDALTGLKLGRSFRGLGRQDGRSILRVLPMAVADFVAESFETDALRGIIAARGVQNTAMGPWSAGTTAVLLADSAGNDGGAAGQSVFARGGPGALSEALAAAVRTFGGEIRTKADVVQVTTADDRVSGVVLASGEEIQARIVIGAADPKHLLTDLVDPVVLGPGLRWRAANIRTPGSVAKVNLVLAGLPAFPAAGSGPDAERLLRGRIVIAPGIDYVERAFDASKYGGISPAPYLEATIPSLIDPGLVDARPAGSRSTAPAHARHERPLPVRAVCAPGGRLVGAPRGDRRDCPGHPRNGRPRDQWAGPRPAGPQPARPGARLRPDRRPSLPRRAEPGQLLRLAAPARQRSLSAAGDGPVPGRLRSAPGRRDHRHPRPERRSRDPQRLEEAPALRPPSSSSSSTSGSMPGRGSVGTRTWRPSRRSTLRAARWAIVSPLCSSR